MKDNPRTQSQPQWRASTARKKVEAYLPYDLVEKLDQLVSDGNYRGRGEALAELIRRCGETAQAPAKIEDQPVETKKLHVDRDLSSHCECETASGSPCRNMASLVIRRKVEGQLVEFSTCKRHNNWKFRPHKSVIKKIMI